MGSWVMIDADLATTARLYTNARSCKYSRVLSALAGRPECIHDIRECFALLSRDLRRLNSTLKSHQRLSPLSSVPHNSRKREKNKKSSFGKELHLSLSSSEHLESTPNKSNQRANQRTSHMVVKSCAPRTQRHGTACLFWAWSRCIVAVQQCTHYAINIYGQRTTQNPRG